MGRYAIAAAVWLMAVVGPSLVAGASQAVPRSDQAGRYIEAALECARLEAGNAWLRSEGERANSGPQSPPSSLLGLSGADPGVQPPLAELLRQSRQQVIDDLQAVGGRWDTELAGVRDSWHEVRSALDEGRLRLFQIQASHRAAGWAAAVFRHENRWRWLAGFLVAGTLAGVAIHAYRQEVRKALRGGRSRATGLVKGLLFGAASVGVIALACFLFGEEIYNWLLAGTGPGTAPPVLSEEEARPLVEKARRLSAERQTLEAAKSDPGPAAAGGSPSQADETERARQQFRRSVLEGVERVAMLEAAAKALAADMAQLRQLETQLEAHKDAAARHDRMLRAVHAVLGWSLLAAVVVGGGLLRWRLRKRQHTVASTCPRCLGRLPPLVRRRDIAVTSATRCPNKLQEGDPAIFCHYEVPDMYRPMAKLCFPVLAVTNSGKTTWLAMLYRQLNRGQQPRGVTFEPIRGAVNGKDACQEYRQIVDQILKNRRGPSPTQTDRLPWPLIFHFQDRDPWGASNLLVNIFDFSGELSFWGVDDYRRRRALDADGFFFFLDPTQDEETQVRALSAFRDDLRVVKGAVQRRPVRVPVALCLSKIDTLRDRLPGGPEAAEAFYEELKQIDPSGQSIALEILEKRSQRVAQLRRELWPGWHIERAIENVFGPRYLFFPLASYGLTPQDGQGRGFAGLDHRLVEPFGLLQPLLWLLHMNGYPVLDCCSKPTLA